jgi:hypothetical protein
VRRKVEARDHIVAQCFIVKLDRRRRLKNQERRATGRGFRRALKVSDGYGTNLFRCRCSQCHHGHDYQRVRHQFALESKSQGSREVPGTEPDEGLRSHRNIRTSIVAEEAKALSVLPLRHFLQTAVALHPPHGFCGGFNFPSVYAL